MSPGFDAEQYLPVQRFCAMSSHPRFWDIARWIGVCLCLLILAAWGVSLHWYVMWDGYRWVRLQSGNVASGWYFCSRAEFDQARASPAASYLRGRQTLQIGRPAMWLSSGGYGLNLPFTIDTGNGQGASYCREVFVPLWFPLLLIATLTAFAFRRARRPPPGHCRICGYNLTGNVSGICPECGAAVPAPPMSSRSQAAD
jgi:hypothetical protein